MSTVSSASGDGAATPMHVLGSAPTVHDITMRMGDTYLGDYYSTRFRPAGAPLVIADGQSGTLTAIAGQREYPWTGIRQLVFFWHDNTFVGWGTDRATEPIERIASPGPGTFDVTYGHFAKTELGATLVLPAVTIAYHWKGSHVVSTEAPPNLFEKVKQAPSFVLPSVLTTDDICNSRDCFNSVTGLLDQGCIFGGFEQCPHLLPDAHGCWYTEGQTGAFGTYLYVPTCDPSVPRAESTTNVTFDSWVKLTSRPTTDDLTMFDCSGYYGSTYEELYGIPASAEGWCGLTLNTVPVGQ